MNTLDWTNARREQQKQTLEFSRGLRQRLEEFESQLVQQEPADFGSLLVERAACDAFANSLTILAFVTQKERNS